MNSTLYVKQYRAAIIYLLALLILCSISFCSDKQNTSDVYGKYKAFSDNPEINKFLAGENNYLELKENQTIIYNTTINNKPKFHFTGTFDFDKKTNALNINWKEGKLPNKLLIEKNKDSYVIKIGQSNYIKI